MKITKEDMDKALDYFKEDRFKEHSIFYQPMNRFETMGNITAGVHFLEQHVTSKKKDFEKSGLPNLAAICIAGLATAMKGDSINFLPHYKSPTHPVEKVEVFEELISYLAYILDDGPGFTIDKDGIKRAQGQMKAALTSYKKAVGAVGRD